MLLSVALGCAIADPLPEHIVIYRLRVAVLGLGVAVALTPPAAVAQDTRTVAGVVRSAADSTPLSGVRVRVLETASRAETDAEGRFAFASVPVTTIRLVFERIGVVTDTVTVAPGASALVLFLQPRAVRVSPLVAEGFLPARQRFEAVVQPSTISLDPAEIRNAPTLLEPDVGRVAQLLPGTVAKNDYSVGLNVRGGEADQNLIRLDGITVFNPFHVGGLFSTFDAAAVERAELITGGFPAGYGGRLSSVMDVAVRDGSRGRVHVQGGVSLLASRVLVDGPIGSTGATFLAGVRRTYADVIADAFADDPFSYYFADGVAKLTVPTGRGRVAATGYWGRDALELPWVEPEPGRDGLDMQFSWGNGLAGATWTQPFGGALLETHLSVSRFTTEFALEPDQLDARNSVRQLAARSALAFRLGDRNEMQVGLGVEDHHITYAFNNASVAVEVPDGIWVGDHRIPYDFRDLILNRQMLDLEYRPRIWFGFIDDQWRPFSRLLLRPGVRVEYVGGGAAFTGVSPRFAAKLFLTDDLAVTGSVGRYYQALHSIRDQEIPITLFDFWIGADERTPVARSDHLVLGIERWFGDDLSLTLEGYAKTYDSLPLANPADDPRVLGDEFVVATGDAWGFDVLLRRHGGAIRGWIGYSYAKATREVESVSFAPAHDRRHTVNLAVEAPDAVAALRLAADGVPEEIVSEIDIVELREAPDYEKTLPPSEAF